VLVPGYAGGLRGGILSAFDRGYSDATASHLYQTLAPRLPESVELAIKKLFVVCSADPRVVGTDRVRVIRALSLRLLLEMIGGRGAEGPFVNRSAVSYGLLADGGGIRLYSESDPEGSLVTLHGDPESEGVLFVQSKPVSTVTVESYNFEKNGYMERIGDFFGRRGISIDNLVSSETSITVTFNEKSLAGQEADILLAELRQDLEEFEADRAGAPVSVSRRALSQIHIGGERIESTDLMARISATLAGCGIAIETGMQPSHPRVVIVGVAREREHEAVRALHGALVEESVS
jgi:aspartokinase